MAAGRLRALGAQIRTWLFRQALVQVDLCPMATAFTNCEIFKLASLSCRSMYQGSYKHSYQHTLQFSGDVAAFQGCRCKDVFFGILDRNIAGLNPGGGARPSVALNGSPSSQCSPSKSEISQVLRLVGSCGTEVHQHNERSQGKLRLL